MRLGEARREVSYGLTNRKQWSDLMEEATLILTEL